MNYITEIQNVNNIVLTVAGINYFDGVSIAQMLNYENPYFALNDYVQPQDKIFYTDPNTGKELLLISESGVYCLINYSNHPQAKNFVNFVYSQIMPMIPRIIRYYATGGKETNYLLLDSNQATNIYDKIIESNNEFIMKMTPNPLFYGYLNDQEYLVTTTQIAKNFGKSAIWLNKFLEVQGIQFKQGKIWFLKQKYAKLNLAKTRTSYYLSDDNSLNFYAELGWTRVGVCFIYDLLVSMGHSPITA